MSPYFPFLLVGFFFGFLSIVFLLVLVFGILMRSLALKLIGGIALCVSAGLVGLCVIACIYIGICDYITLVAGPNTRTKPNLQDLVGVYRPTREKFRFIRKGNSLSIHETSLTLHADGSFEMKDIPAEWFDWSSEAKSRLGSGSGKWELDSHKYGRIRHWGLELSFTSSEGLTSTSRNGRFVYSMLSLRKQKPPYDIYMTLGDPDGGRGLQFERVDTKR